MIASPLRPRHRQESGIAAAGQLAHRGTPYGASLSFATTTHLWPLPDPPSRKSRSATSRTGTARSIPGRALASSVLDSPCQGSRTGLTPPISTSVPSTPATPHGYAARLRDDGRSPHARGEHSHRWYMRCRDPADQSLPWSGHALPLKAAPARTTTTPIGTGRPSRKLRPRPTAVQLLDSQRRLSPGRKCPGDRCARRRARSRVPGRARA